MTWLDHFTFGVETIDGVEIAYVKGGSGPPLLMLHGYPQNMALWAPVAPKLSQHFTVVCADLRGYGASGKPRCATDNSNYSFRAMADDQIGLMRKLGFESFHLVGHDRGGRTAHRLALDHPDAVLSLSLLDIVPTYTMLKDVNRDVAASYWHWYFLAQPGDFSETVIARDPDLFFENALVGWGATRLQDFNQRLLEDYRRSWRQAGMIHGSCADYRAALTVDFYLDEADRKRRVKCPTLILYGASGVIARLFDVGAEWRKFCAHVAVDTVPGGHFFIDLHPDQVADRLLAFLPQDACPVPRTHA